MDKSGTFAVTSGAYRTITGWAIRSGYPDTVLAGNGMALMAGTYDLVAYFVWTSSVAPSGLQISIDGTAVASATNQQSPYTLTASGVVVPNDGAILTVAAYPGVNTTIQTTMYVTATPV